MIRPQILADQVHNPISTQEEQIKYAHPITTRTPGFSDLPKYGPSIDLNEQRKVKKMGTM